MKYPTWKCKPKNPNQYANGLVTHQWKIFRKCLRHQRKPPKKQKRFEKFYSIYHEPSPTIIIIFISFSSFSSCFSFATMQWTREQTYRNNNNNKMGLSLFPLPVFSLSPMRSPMLLAVCLRNCLCMLMMKSAHWSGFSLRVFPFRSFVTFGLCVLCIYINGFSCWFVLIFLLLSQGCANVWGGGGGAFECLAYTKCKFSMNWSGEWNYM